MAPNKGASNNFGITFYVKAVFPIFGLPLHVTSSRNKNPFFKMCYPFPKIKSESSCIGHLCVWPMANGRTAGIIRIYRFSPAFFTSLAEA